jgi:hypothetical protein
MFYMHSMFSLELIALVAGVALLLYVQNQPKIKSFWPVFVAWFVIVVSVLSILCSVYFSLRMWSSDGFAKHKGRMMERMMEKKSMQDSSEKMK